MSEGFHGLGKGDDQLGELHILARCRLGVLVDRALHTQKN